MELDLQTNCSNINCMGNYFGNKMNFEKYFMETVGPELRDIVLEKISDVISVIKDRNESSCNLFIYAVDYFYASLKDHKIDHLIPLPDGLACIFQQLVGEQDSLMTEKPPKGIEQHTKVEYFKSDKQYNREVANTTSAIVGPLIFGICCLIARYHLRLDPLAKKVLLVLSIGGIAKSIFHLMASYPEKIIVHEVYN